MRNKERIVLNIDSLPADSYNKNKIRIKLKPGVSAIKQKGAKSLGRSGLDLLSLKHDVRRVEKLTDRIPRLSKGRQKDKEKIEKRRKEYGFDRWFDIEFDHNVDIKAVIAEYEALDTVEIVEPIVDAVLYDDFEGVLFEPGEPGTMLMGDFPNDLYFSQQWHYMKIHLPQAWDICKGSGDVKVGIIDQGADPNHPDQTANWGDGFIGNTAGNGLWAVGKHGCHTGGTIAAVNNNGEGVCGIAGGDGTPGSGCKLYCGMVFRGGTGGMGFDTATIWAADEGVAILNNSWGYLGPDYISQAVADAIDYFLEYGGGDVLQGGLYVASAGNSNKHENLYPAAYPGVLSVAATDKNDIKAFYSTYNDRVGISAPGGDMRYAANEGILSLNEANWYVWLQGTSMAAPHVAGVAALIVSKFPGVFTQQQLFDILCQSADEIDSLNPEYSGLIGTGRLNAHAAMLLAGELASVSNPKNLTVSNQGEDLLIEWDKNDALDNVIIVANEINLFGNPSIFSEVGHVLESTDIVIYKGSATEFLYTNLRQDKTYYFKAWSYNEDQVSLGTTVVFKTTSISSKINRFPYVKTFDSGISNAWTNTGWTSGESYLGFSRNFNLRDYAFTSGGSLVTPVFDLFGLLSVKVSFQQSLKNIAGKTFEVSLDGGSSWSSIYTPLAVGSSNVVLDILSVSDNMKFRWVSVAAEDEEDSFWAVDNFYVFGYDTASFHTILIEKVGNGDCSLLGEFKVEDVGATSQGLLLSVFPSLREGFIQWNITPLGGVKYSVNSYNFLLPLDNSYSVEAEFSLKFRFQISTIGDGLTFPASGTQYLEEGTEVIIEAVEKEPLNPEDPKNYFYRWNINGAYFYGPIQTVIVSEDVVVQAIFRQKRYYTVEKIGNGTTNPAPGQYDALYGTMINVTAIPDPGYTFLYWIKVSNGETTNWLYAKYSGNIIYDTALIAYFSGEYDANIIGSLINEAQIAEGEALSDAPVSLELVNKGQQASAEIRLRFEVLSSLVNGDQVTEATLFSNNETDVVLENGRQLINIVLLSSLNFDCVLENEGQGINIDVFTDLGERLISVELSNSSQTAGGRVETLSYGDGNCIICQIKKRILAIFAEIGCFCRTKKARFNMATKRSTVITSKATFKTKIFDGNGNNNQ